MNAQKVKNREGFTIIEVVLVLAIAALIFLMVFIALPALQRNQRDTARKTVLGKVASAVTSYQSNNRGKNPTAVTALGGYLDADKTGSPPAYTSPLKIEGSEYSVGLLSAAPATPGTASAAKDYVQIFAASKCNDSNQAIAGTTRQAAVIIQLENGDAFLCQDV
jgi:prepilin-type N-terminal cleavage/methylation domain-containing protein